MNIRWIILFFKKRWQLNNPNKKKIYIYRIGNTEDNRLSEGNKMDGNWYPFKTIRDLPASLRWKGKRSVTHAFTKVDHVVVAPQYICENREWLLCTFWHTNYYYYAFIPASGSQNKPKVETYSGVFFWLILLDDDICFPLGHGNWHIVIFNIISVCEIEMELLNLLHSRIGIFLFQIKKYFCKY